jgi:hypothetical protein
MGGLGGRGLRGARARRWAAATAVVALAAVVSSGAAYADVLVQTVEAESMTLPATGATVVADANASGGQVVRITSNGSVTTSVSLSSATTSLTVRVRGEYCRGNWARFRVFVNGVRVLNKLISSTQLADEQITLSLAAGSHQLSYTVANPASNSTCARAASVDLASFFAPGPPPPPVPTVTLSAQPTSVAVGESSTVTWSSTDADTCSASGAWSGARATSGQEATGPLATGEHTFTLTCSGPGGQASQSVVVTASDAPPPPPPELLPDLDPAAPTSIQAISGEGGIVYLTFVFATDNVGAGPLILNGHRASTAEAAMTVDQEIRRTDGTSTTVPNVGLFTWMDQTGYRRWGFQYQVYELRQASDFALVRTANPEGLCVIDTTSAPGSYPGEPSAAVYTGCGNQEPTRLTLQEGLSVGWRNRHSAGKLGQLIDITTLPSGTYVLVQRANASGLLHESSTANNASSARVTITWVAGQTLPTVQVIQSCSATETCGS